jgi:hypothetical protein
VVIRYEPLGPTDQLTCRALVDVGRALATPTILGAWMTRTWVLTYGGQTPRATADVDVGAPTEVGYAQVAAAALERLGYEQDRGGYPFRYAKLTRDGLQIADLLIDASSAPSDGSAQPVYGLTAASASLTDVKFEISGVGSAAIRVPTLDGAFLLRLLALEDGPGGLKFPDYASDAASLGLLLLDDPDALSRWRDRSGGPADRARLLAADFFGNSTSAGATAAAGRTRGDGELVARRVSSAIRALI